MKTILKDWGGAIEIDGQTYDTVQDAMSVLESMSDSMHIKLHAKRSSAQKAHVERVSDITEYSITVKKYMTEKSSSGFDFMKKWNNDNPMPMRTMTGTIEKETRGMVFMKLHGQALETVTCQCCGRELTNPISRYYGIGPICLSKIGIACDIDNVDEIKERLVNMTWEGWVIKSSILKKEEKKS